MKMKLKITGIIMALTVTAGAAGWTNNAGAQDLSSSTDAVSVVTGLGLAKPGIKADKMTSRGEFAELVYNLVGLGEKGSGTAFSDAAEGSEYYDAVMYLYNRGIISGRGDGIFDISAPITVNEAVKIAVMAVGIGFNAEADGGYPSGYLKAAGTEGLLDGVKTESETGYFTYENACRIIYNCFDVNIWEISLTGSKAEYESRHDKTILSEYLSIEKIKGVMTDNGITGYGGSTGAGYDNVIIGGRLCENSDPANRAFLGCSLEAYVRVDKDGNSSLLYAYPVKTKTVSLNSFDIESVSESVLEYYEKPDSGRIKKLKLSPVMDVVYNDTVIPLRSEEQLIPARGTVELVDNNDDGVYDVYKIFEYTSYIAESVDEGLEKIYTKYGAGAISLGDYDSYTIYYDNTEITISDIEEFNTLSVFVNSGRNTAQIYVTDDAPEGTVTAISEDYIYLDSVPYRYTGKLNKSIYLGQQAKLMIDHMGYISGVDTVFGGGNVYGYILKAYVDETGENAFVKLFTTNGFIETLECASRVKVDGSSVSNETDVVRYLTSDGRAVNQAVMFEVNSEGELMTLDTLYTGPGGEKDSLKCDLPAARQRFKQDGIFGGRVSASEDTAIIRIPEDISDTEEFRLGRLSDFEVDKSYNIEAYNCSIVNIPELILWYATSDDSFNNADSTYLVDKITDEVTNDGEIVRALHGFGRSGEKVIYSDNGEFNDVLLGDVIHCETKSSGYVSRIEKVFDYKHMELATSSIDYFNTYSANYLTVKAAENGRIIAEVKGADYVYNLSSTSIYTYDKSNPKEKITKVNYSELNAGDQLFVQLKAGDVRMAVLYQ